ncbi:MAG: hypothetical protein BJ554DRAFT_4868 [Olpidium bornovanus]|uniref:Retrovirus-related Pol polyprotein from transposon TNT 1-94-like beta-barrel domain-containing protein n=1 Tax=Olpidium bornovanus TaxID=278681 RepID=A0A8H8DL34_9FUNG|nr:MAG: hypothetical protein BJ554DRAFT_4868 [Olpidium bornovanus]
MGNAIQAAQLNEQVALAVAVNKLAEQAAIPWLTHAKDNRPGSPRRWTIWSDLKDALNEHLFPREHKKAMEKTLTNIPQSKCGDLENARSSKTGSAYHGRHGQTNPSTCMSSGDVKQAATAPYVQADRHADEKQSGHQRQNYMPQLRNGGTSNESPRPTNPSVAFHAGSNDSKQQTVRAVLDSGCTRHVLNQQEWIASMSPTSQAVCTATKDNDQHVDAHGNVHLHAVDTKAELTLEDALYTPSFRMPLISVPAATYKGLDVIFKADGKALIVKGGKLDYDELIATGTPDDTTRLFHMNSSGGPVVHICPSREAENQTTGYEPNGTLTLPPLYGRRRPRRCAPPPSRGAAAVTARPPPPPPAAAQPPRARAPPLRARPAAAAARYRRAPPPPLRARRLRRRAPTAAQPPRAAAATAARRHRRRSPTMATRSRWRLAATAAAAAASIYEAEHPQGEKAPSTPRYTPERSPGPGLPPPAPARLAPTVKFHHSSHHERMPGAFNATPAAVNKVAESSSAQQQGNASHFDLRGLGTFLPQQPLPPGVAAPPVSLGRGRGLLYLVSPARPVSSGEKSPPLLVQDVFLSQSLHLQDLVSLLVSPGRRRRDVEFKVSRYKSMTYTSTSRTTP